MNSLVRQDHKCGCGNRLVNQTRSQLIRVLQKHHTNLNRLSLKELKELHVKELDQTCIDKIMNIWSDATIMRIRNAVQTVHERPMKIWSQRELYNLTISGLERLYGNMSEENNLFQNTVAELEQVWQTYGSHVELNNQLVDFTSNKCKMWEKVDCKFFANKETMEHILNTWTGDSQNSWVTFENNQLRSIDFHSLHAKVLSALCHKKQLAVLQKTILPEDVIQHIASFSCYPDWSWSTYITKRKAWKTGLVKPNAFKDYTWKQPKPYDRRLKSNWFCDDFYQDCIREQMSDWQSDWDTDEEIVDSDVDDI